ncbi:MAG: 50S ribosomal protein L11 methyltransferase [Candidatus Caldarchaeum sp.]
MLVVEMPSDKESSPKWVQVSAIFPEPPADWSLIHEIFAKEGCAGSLEGETPPSLSGFLYESPLEGKIFARLGRALVDAGAVRVEFKGIPEENWHETWKRQLKPCRIGRHLVIIPFKENALDYDQEKDIVILIEPGQAFGTGEHPTTQLCLELLEKHLKPNMRVLDVGTGSGILAIAAKKLGAREVIATDIEATAIEIARENAAKNNVEITCLLTQQVPKEEGFDLVVANLFSSTLIRLSSSLCHAIIPKGVLIVSGVISQNWNEVRRSLECDGVELLSTYSRDGWVAATFIKTF